MKVRNWSRPPSPPSQCWKLKCWQKHKFDHQHRIQHWFEGGRGSKSSRKLSHLCIFGETWSADRCINSIIITGSNIDPRGGGDIRASENGHISSLFVLHEVRKCVELFYWNWPGLTLSSPIRFSSADRRTKSISWNVEWRVKECMKMT